MPAADDILKRLKELFDGDETLDEEKDGKRSAQPVIGGTAIVRRKDAPTVPVSGDGKSAGGKEQGGPNGTMTEEELYGFTRFYMFHSLENIIRAAEYRTGLQGAQHPLPQSG